MSAAPWPPPVERLGDAVLVRGPAVVQLAALVDLFEREHRRDAFSGRPLLRHIGLELRAAADQIVSGVGRADVRTLVDGAPSTHGEHDAIGIREAAELLGLCDRQTRRRASDLDGRKGPTGHWIFDRAVVELYAAERRHAKDE